MESIFDEYQVLESARRLYENRERERATMLLRDAISSQGTLHRSPLRPNALLLLVEILSEDLASSYEAQELLRLNHIADSHEGRVAQLVISYRQGSATLEDAAVATEWVSHVSSRTSARLRLFIGKILAEHGALEHARRWIAGALHESRKAMETDLVAASTGALAEVLFLGGDAKSALELFSLDAQLLPVGSRDTERLIVYRAHCFRQLHQIEVARSLYTYAQQLSEIRGESNPFALRGLLWCAVLEGEKDEAQSIFSRVERANDAHSTAFGLLGVAALEQEAKERAARLNAAASLFESERYSREYLWCKGKSPEVKTIPLALSANPGPHVIDICDAPFLEHPLTPIELTYTRSAQAFTAGDHSEWMAGFF